MYGCIYRGMHVCAYLYTHKINGYVLVYTFLYINIYLSIYASL